MAKDYGKKNSVGSKRSASGQLMLLLVAFLSGYLSATVFDFTSLTNWVNKQLQAQQNPQLAKKQVVQQAQIPKPKFEFYTLLASQQAATVPVSNVPPVTAASTATISAAATPSNPIKEPLAKTPVLPVPLSTVATAGKSATLAAINKDAYLVQIASFKSRQEAERVKATLSLKGFVVSIASVNQQQTIWYRVVIGPFASRDQAQKAQISVARTEHLVGMIRKMA